MSFFFFNKTFASVSLSGSFTRAVRGLPLSNARQERLVSPYSKSIFQSCVRLRLERFVFDQTKFRTYVFFKNVLTLSIFRFRFWLMSERSAVRALSRRSNRSFMAGEAFALVLVRAVGFMFTLVGGLFFFIRLVAAALQRMRRQWAVVMQMLQLLDTVRMGFWYHTHLQYRVGVSGRLGGVMRASKRFVGHGALKLYLWQGALDYVQTDVRTQWGVFGFSFWLQFRNVPQLRVVRFVQRYRKILRSLLAVAQPKAPRPTLPTDSVPPYTQFSQAYGNICRARVVKQTNKRRTLPECQLDNECTVPQSPQPQDPREYRGFREFIDSRVPAVTTESTVSRKSPTPRNVCEAVNPFVSYLPVELAQFPVEPEPLAKTEPLAETKTSKSKKYRQPRDTYVPREFRLSFASQKRLA